MLFIIVHHCRQLSCEMKSLVLILPLLLFNYLFLNIQCKPIPNDNNLDPDTPDDLKTEEQIRAGSNSNTDKKSSDEEEDLIFKPGSIKKIPGNWAEFHLSFKPKKHLTRGVNLESDIDFRLDLLETGSSPVVSPSDITWKHNADRDYQVLPTYSGLKKIAFVSLHILYIIRSFLIWGQ